MRKTCTCCGKRKNIKHFYKSKNNIDGYHNKCKECMKQNMNQYYIDNKNKILNRKKKHYNSNKKRIIKSATAYYNNKMLSDPLYKLKKDISGLIRNSLKYKGFHKNGKRTTSILGCTLQEFKVYLESKFET